MKRKRLFDRLVDAVGTQYGALFVMLIVTIAINPLFRDAHFIRLVVDLTLLAVFIAAIQAIRGDKRIRKWVFAIGLLAISCSVISRSFHVEALYSWGAGLRAGFFAVLIAAIFSDIFRRDKVTIDAVLGACAIYALMSMGWASVYEMLESLHPGSFHLPNIVSIGGDAGFSAMEFELEYYSMITLTTVGYGDIYPVSPAARTMASLEGFLGQLYLAIVIARLVAMQITERYRS